MNEKWAYYNEFDSKAAEWIRQLIALKAIPDGEVDVRDIRQVRADDLKGFRQIHLFCGVAGWPLAIKQAGWPDDRFTISGSPPCQSFSTAGLQRGFADERHLWPHMFRLVSELRPDYCFGEQVASKLALTWWDAVANDLESADYAAAAVDLAGGSAGAPHIRSRLFWLGRKLGDSSSDRWQWSGQAGETEKRWESESESGGQLPQGSQRPSANGTLDDPDSSVSTVSVDRVSSQGDSSVGRLDPTADCSSPPTSIPATFWDDCDWIECRDGKFRPTGKGIYPLAGVPGLDREYVRSQLERCAQKLFSGWDDPYRSEKAQIFARLVFESRNVGAISPKLRKMDAIVPSSLVSSCDSSSPDFNSSQEARIMRLKGYGNAIVVSLAVEFLKSIMELES